MNVNMAVVATMTLAPGRAVLGFPENVVSGVIGLPDSDVGYIQYSPGQFALIPIRRRPIKAMGTFLSRFPAHRASKFPGLFKLALRQLDQHAKISSPARTVKTPLKFLPVM